MDNESKDRIPENFSDIIDPDLVATIAALGSFEGSNYVKGEECAICIVDIIKFLRLEDKKTCDVRLQISKSKTMEKDLLPIITTYYDDQEILESLVRLFVNLTMPALLCLEQPEVGRKDKRTTTIDLEINTYLRYYKELFVSFNIMKVFSSQLGHLLQLGRASRTDEDDLMLERLMIIIRNILHVPGESFQEQQLQHSLSTHDKLVLSLIDYGVADLLLYLCGSRDEEHHCLLSLEIMSLIFREFDPTIIAQQKSNQDNIKIDKELEELKLKETLHKQKQVNLRKSRHSRFGGTFVIQGKKSITERDIIYHKSIKKIQNLSFDDEKNIVRHTRFNAIVEDHSSIRYSTAKTRNALKQLTQKFLDVCYNRLMKKAKSLLCRNVSSDKDCDESFYLWSCKFFMEFNRCSTFKIELVAETLSIDTFSYILQIIFKFHEDIKSCSAKQIEDKKKVARRLHNAVKAYREMLENLSLMTISKDQKIKNIGCIIENNIFYQQEYRELPTLLLKQFSKQFFTKQYLTDLIECTHIYIRMLDSYSKQNTLIVQETGKKSKSKGKRKKKKKNLLSEREMQEMWDGDIEREVLNVLSTGDISTRSVRPFDASSDYSMEQQRIVCKHTIQDLLKSGSFDEAVALYKAAREVWPESPSFGMPDMAIIDEVNVVKSIFMSREDVPDFMSGGNDAVEEHEQNSELASTELHTVKEHKFQNSQYHMLYARPGIIQSYCYLLKFFDANSKSANHAIVKMLYRMASSLAMTPIMYQLSFFITLQKILAAPKVDAYKEMKKFAAFIVRKFTSSLKESPLLCIDTVFWKTPDDVLMIDNNYDESKMPTKKKAVIWTPHEEEEIKSLFEKWIDKSDVVDLCDMIAQDMITGEKERMDVKTKIIELHLVSNESQHLLKRKPQKRVVWLPSEKEDLQKFYEDFRYEKDPVALIQEKLDNKSRKSVIKELENLLGIRKKDLDVNRCIWTKDDDEELRIMYEHLSESHTGTELLAAIAAKIPKPRSVDEVKDALIRLKLRRDENSSAHFWTTGEVTILEKHKLMSDKKQMVLKIKFVLPDIDINQILKKLLQLNTITSAEATSLLMDISDLDSDAENSDGESSEEEEDEFDFFDIPKHVKSLRPDHSAALTWVENIMKTIIDSREETLDYDTVFIIPREDAHQTALESPIFQQLLKCVGAVPPLSAHETYWKITSCVSDNVLKKGHGLITGQCTDSDSEMSDFGEQGGSPSQAARPSKHAESSDDDNMDDFLEQMRGGRPIPQTSIMVTQDIHNVSEESDKENQGSHSPKTKRKSDFISDSESENEFSNSMPKKKKVAVINFSDSDD